MAKKLGRDSSFIAVMAGPVGFGIPKWILLVFVYFAVVFGLAWNGDPAGQRAATIAGAVGPGMIGLLDLVLRLRTTHIVWINSAGGEMVSTTTIVDRLTFQECGWYLPIITLPLPLWFGGLGLSVVFIHEWGLLPARALS